MLLLMEKINKEIKLPSNRKEIDFHGSQTYWPTSIIKIIQWFPFLIIIYHTVDKMETQITLLPSLLKKFAMFQIHMFFINKIMKKIWWMI